MSQPLLERHACMNPKQSNYIDGNVLQAPTKTKESDFSMLAFLHEIVEHQAIEEIASGQDFQVDLDYKGPLWRHEIWSHLRPQTGTLLGSQIAC